MATRPSSSDEQPPEELNCRLWDVRLLRRDVALLPKVLNAASRFTEAPDDAAMSALADRTAADPLFV
jgi:hypothetical protein